MDVQLLSDLPHSDAFCCSTSSSSWRSPAAPWKGCDWHSCWARGTESLFMCCTMTSAERAWTTVIRFVWVCLVAAGVTMSVPTQVMQTAAPGSVSHPSPVQKERFWRVTRAWTAKMEASSGIKTYSYWQQPVNLALHVDIIQNGSLWLSDTIKHFLNKERLTV